MSTRTLTPPRSWVLPLAAIAGSVAVLMVLSPHLILTATTPAGGDMGAHVLGPAYLRDVLLPQGRILGWSDAWFAGFPAFYFYFPLPSLVIVLLDLLLPYGVAFKIVTVLGVVGLPPAVVFMSRSMGFSVPISIMTGAGAVVFAVMESYTIYGGNVASTMAGEFSYSWSFSLGMVYLGLLVRAARGERRLVPWAVAVLAATVLCHILTTLVLVPVSLIVLFRRGAWRSALPIWVWAFAVTGFWSVPLLARIGLTSDMSWTPLSRWEEVFPIELWFLLPFAVGGAVWAVRTATAVAPLVLATLVPIIYYPLPTVLPQLVPSLGEDRWKLWNGRLLPYWYFGVTFFAVVGIGALLLWATRRLPDRVSGWWPRLAGVVAAGGLGWLVVFRDGPGWAGVAVAAGGLAIAALSLAWLAPVASRTLLVCVVAAVVAGGALSGTNFIYKWAAWNFGGYETKDAWPEYQGIMETVGGLPDGRVQWEQDSTDETGLDKYGTPMAPMLFPYWTEWTHPSMEGLFFESSLTTPFHFLNATAMSAKPSSPIPGLPYHRFDFDRGLPQLELYGVRYYVSYSEDAATEADRRPELTKVAESPPFAVYELADVAMVEVADHQPAVYEPGPDGGSFHDLALEWYDDPSLHDQWITETGPADWPRVSSLADLPDQELDAAGEVSDVELSDHRVSFSTTAVGVPHVVKVSYFPNWTAQGASGPYYATPSLMVVVPTSEQVVLEFENTWAEWTGNGLTVLGLAGFGWLGVSRLRRQGGPDSPQPGQRPRHAA